MVISKVFIKQLIIKKWKSSPRKMEPPKVQKVAPEIFTKIDFGAPERKNEFFSLFSMSCFYRVRRSTCGEKFVLVSHMHIHIHCCWYLLPMIEVCSFKKYLNLYIVLTVIWSVNNWLIISVPHTVIDVRPVVPTASSQLPHLLESAR